MAAHKPPPHPPCRKLLSAMQTQGGCYSLRSTEQKGSRSWAQSSNTLTLKGDGVCGSSSHTQG